MLLRHAPAFRLLTFALVMLGLTAVEVLVPQPADAFEDTAGETWDDAVQALAEADIINGCGDGEFCPSQQFSRAQMASIFVASLELPDAAAGAGPFGDVAGSTHEQAINTIAAAGIAHGCTAEDFCPDEPITRGQMASLLTAAFDLEGSDAAYFDDSGSTHGDAIDALASAGVTAGCGEALTSFCPRAEVKRWQAAVFVARTLELVDRIEVSSLAERREQQAEIDAARAAKEAARQEAAREAETQRVVSRGDRAVKTALAQVGKPYKWGGNGPGSFDCSGLTSYAWRSAGVELPRTSSQQYSGTKRISRSQLQPGDMIFYGRSGITHVAMYVGGGDVVEAPYAGKNVRVSSSGLSRSDIVGYGRPR